jgi:hypothetical protein
MEGREHFGILAACVVCGVLGVACGGAVCGGDFIRWLPSVVKINIKYFRISPLIKLIPLFSYTKHIYHDIRIQTRHG